MSQKVKIKFTDFECNLLINDTNEFRNMLLAEDLPTEDVIMSNKNTIQYRQVGDYLIPNLILPPEAANIRLGKWGMMHKTYLEKHKKVLFSTLLIQGKLYQHCAEIENQAKDMLDFLVEQMKASEDVTEELKEQDQWEWVQKMENIQQRAEEIACRELVYV